MINAIKTMIDKANKNTKEAKKGCQKTFQLLTPDPKTKLYKKRYKQTTKNTFGYQETKNDKLYKDLLGDMYTSNNHKDKDSNDLKNSKDLDGPNNNTH